MNQGLLIAATGFTGFADGLGAALGLVTVGGVRWGRHFGANNSERRISGVTAD